MNRIKFISEEELYLPAFCEDCGNLLRPKHNRRGEGVTITCMRCAVMGPPTTTIKEDGIYEVEWSSSDY